MLPTLTLTDPQNEPSEMSLAMSPLVGTDSNTSFEFDRSSGRPGTASSTGNDDGKPVHVAVFCHEEGSTRREAGEQKRACLSHVPPCSNKPCKGRLSRTNQVNVMPSASRPDTPQSSLRSPGRQHNKTNSNTTSSPSRGPSPGRDANLRQDVRPPIDPLSQVRTFIPTTTT
jgi:hypothetical protein